MINPCLERMVHPTGHDELAAGVKVCAEHLVPVALDPAVDHDISLRLHVPHPDK